MGSALKLRNVFIKKLSDLLYNVTTLDLNVAMLRKNEILALCNVATLDPNIATFKIATYGTS